MGNTPSPAGTGEQKALLAASQGRRRSSLRPQRKRSLLKAPLRARSFLRKEYEGHQDYQRQGSSLSSTNDSRSWFGTFDDDNADEHPRRTSEYLEALEENVTRLQEKCAALESQAILSTVQQLDLWIRGIATALSLLTLFLYWKWIVLQAVPWSMAQLSNTLSEDIFSAFSNVWILRLVQGLVLLLPFVYDRWTHGSTHRRFEVFSLFFCILIRIRMCRWREQQFLQDDPAPSSIPRYGESCTNDGIWEASYEVNARLLYLSISRMRGLWTKVAQYMSSRADFVPLAYIRELSKLQDQAPATPWKDVEPLLPKALLDDLMDFEETPIASASIGQVHLAKLRSTQQAVVVKVQHPHARTLMTDDFWSLHVLCQIIAWIEPEYAFLKILMNEWAIEARKELDFNFEANHLDQANEALIPLFPTKDTVIYSNPAEQVYSSSTKPAATVPATPFQIEVPQPIRSLSNRNVLVMNFCEGCKIDDFEQMAKWGLPREAVMDGVSQAFAHFMYCSPIFNGDPHAGNLLVRKGTYLDADEGFTIVILDWGLAKQLPEDKHIAFCQMVYAAATLDYGLLLDSHKTIGLKLKREDSGQNMEDIRYFLRDMAPRSVAQKRIKSKMKQMNETAEKTKEKVPMESKAYPGEFFFFVRVTELLHGLGSRFSVTLAYLDALAPYAERGLRMSNFFDIASPKSSPIVQPTIVNAKLQSALKKTLTELKKKGNVAGGQVCVIDKEGKTQAQVSAGDLGGLRSHVPMSDDALILGYSTTKAIAATLAHLMVKEGYLTYDEPVCEKVWTKFCPTSTAPSKLGKALGRPQSEVDEHWSWKREITLRHILSHSAGLWASLPTKLTIKKMASCEECFRSYEYNPEAPEDTILPTSRPGEGNQAYHFMSFGWLVAGTLCGAYALKHNRDDDVTFQEVYEALLLPKLSERTIAAGFCPVGNAEGHVLAQTVTADIRASKMIQNRRQMEMENGTSLENGGEVANMMKVFEGKEFLLDPRIWNSRDALNANVPAASGRFSAAGLASFYHDLGNGSILDPGLLEDIATKHVVETSGTALQGVTQISNDTGGSGDHTKMGLGYQLIRTDRDSKNFYSGLGHAGVGGSIGFLHRPTGLSIAVMLNKADGDQNVTMTILRTIGQHYKI